jgi:hypothetical protein
VNERWSRRVTEWNGELTSRRHLEPFTYRNVRSDLRGGLAIICLVGVFAMWWVTR